VYAFQFLKLNSISEATQVLQSVENSKIIAGGMTLIPTMKQRLASPACLIDLSSIKELQVIQLKDQYLEIGSLCTHHQVSDSPLVRHHLPTLAKLAGLIADPQVRYKGTLGGSLANNDPAADYPAALLGLHGIVKTNLRLIPAEEFFLGMFSTHLAPEEIILSILWPLGMRASYQKFRHPSSGYALCGVWMTQSQEGFRVAVTGVFQAVCRWREAEILLNEGPPPYRFEDMAIDLSDILATHDQSAPYKAQLMRVLCSRAIRELNP
jgi:aerobic carbon-monoxide dehydrogenase medium subunit